MKRFQALLGIAALLAMLGWASVRSVPAVQAALPALDRVTALPQVNHASGPRVDSALKNEDMGASGILGYTVVLRQFKAPLVSPTVQRALPRNDTVLQFSITWRHGDRQLVGLLHAFRHGAQLHLAVHQKVYFTDRSDAATATRPRMVPFELEGTVDGVRTDAGGFLIGTRVKVDFRAKLAGDVFGTRLILEGPLSIQRIGV